MNNRGFSLVSTIIASAIMGIVMMTMASMYTQQAKMSQRLRFQSEVGNTAALLKIALRSPENCLKTFLTTPAAGINRARKFPRNGQ